MKKDNLRCHDCGHIKEKHNKAGKRCQVGRCRCKGYYREEEKKT